MSKAKVFITGYVTIFSIIGTLIQFLSHIKPDLFCKHYMQASDSTIAECLGLFDISVLYTGIATKHIFVIYLVLLPFAVWHNWAERENIPLLRIACIVVTWILVGNIVMLAFSQNAGETGPIHIREWVLALVSLGALVISLRIPNHAADTTATSPTKGELP